VRDKLMKQLEHRSQLIVAADEELARKRAAFEAEQRAWNADREDVAAELAAKVADLETARRNLRYERQRWEREWTVAIMQHGRNPDSSDDQTHGGDASGESLESDALALSTVSSSARLLTSRPPTPGAEAVLDAAAREAQRLRRARAVLEAERETMSRELRAALEDAAVRAKAIERAAAEVARGREEIAADRAEMVAAFDDKVKALGLVKARLERKWKQLKEARRCLEKEPAQQRRAPSQSQSQSQSHPAASDGGQGHQGSSGAGDAVSEGGQGGGASPSPPPAGQGTPPQSPMAHTSTVYPLRRDKSNSSVISAVAGLARREEQISARERALAQRVEAVQSREDAVEATSRQAQMRDAEASRMEELLKAQLEEARSKHSRASRFASERVAYVVTLLCCCAHAVLCYLAVCGVRLARTAAGAGCGGRVVVLLCCCCVVVVFRNPHAATVGLPASQCVAGCAEDTGRRHRAPQRPATPGTGAIARASVEACVTNRVIGTWCLVPHGVLRASMGASCAC